MSITEHPPTFAAPIKGAWFYKIPIFGWIARDIAQGDVNNIYFALIAFVSLWGISTLTFGLPGLYLPALALVPVCFIVLIWISLGRIDQLDEHDK